MRPARTSARPATVAAAARPAADARGARPGHAQVPARPNAGWAAFALGSHASAVEALQAVLDEPAQALPTDLDEPLAAGFGHDFSGVRLHTGATATLAARAWQARAFTVGCHVVFDGSAWAPESPAGRLLLAHELAHVVQQSGDPGFVASAADVQPEAESGAQHEREAELAAEAVVAGRPATPLSRVAGPLLQRGDPPAATTAAGPLVQPPEAAASVSLAGLRLLPQEGTLLDPGVDREDQQWAMLLHRLAPSLYQSELIARVKLHLQATGGYRLQQTPLRGRGPHALAPLNVECGLTLRVIDFLESGAAAGEPRANWLRLRAPQLEMLELGREVDQTVADTRDPDLASALTVDFPPWYTPAMFRADAHNFGELLRAQMAQRRAMAAATAAGGDSPSRSGLTSAQNALFAAMAPAARAAEAMRLEPLLQDDPSLRELWGLPPDAATTPAQTSTRPTVQATQTLLAFIRTQPALLQAIEQGEAGEPPHTVTLFTRFIRFAARFSPRSEGDASLSNQPTDRNADPLPAQVAAWPQLEPPNYDAALGTDHLFSMDVSFSDVWEHLANNFGGYGYFWEVIRVPDEDLEQIEATAAAPAGSGNEPGWSDVWGARMSRQGRYAVADLSRSLGLDSAAGRINALQLAIGPPFGGMPTALLANAALRALGEVVSTFFDMLTTPRNERRIVFPNAGLWVVRATCSPVLTDESEYRRAPSVAWVPVFARSAETMGLLRMEQALGVQLQQEMRLTEILLRLEGQNECGPEWDELVRARDALALQLYGNAGDLLREQLRAMEVRLAEPDLTAATAAALTRQRDALRLQIENRDERAGELAGSQRLRLVFITDTGTVIHPLIEGVPHEEAGRFRWYLSDVTAPSGVDVNGVGASRDEALINGLVEIFERHTGYGRGELQIFVPERSDPGRGRIEHRRIEASATALAMESVERITAVVSVAAMVAAPFTGGASLAILLPVGVIGAVPSAYRLADRAENGTLEPDVQTLLDVVNIVGAGLGAAGEGAGALRLVRLQRFVVITGMGTDGLTLMATSYELIQQIEQLPPDMPQGARRAAVMRIMAAELQAIGMTAAGHLLGRADAMEGATRARGDEPLPRPGEAAPGARAPAEPHPGGGAPLGPPAPRRAPSPEMEAHLPPDLQGRVRVESDSSLAEGSAEVRYELDVFGTIRDVYIAHGEGAAPGSMAGHATAARQLLQLGTFGGRLRTLWNRLRLALGGSAPPRPGTEAFNAQFEVPKLREWLARRQADVREGRADAEQVNAERALYEDQIAYYEDVLARFHLFGEAGGTGTAVAARSRLQWTRERLRQRFAIEAETLPVPRPAGWRGEHEAAWRGYPQAEPGHGWRVDPAGGEPLYVPNRLEGGTRRAFDAARGEFVSVGADITANGLLAVREGLPPPPADHHYRYYEDSQSWELALNEGAADRGVTPLTLRESTSAPGSFEFVPREEGAGTLIRRPPYRSDLELGRTRPSDLLASAETRARYEELLNRRDAALRAREAARDALPTEPDPGDAAAHRAWEELPAVREYLRLRNQVGIASRDIGSFAADAHVRRQWPGAERIHPAEGVALDVAGSSAGDFDMVYRLPDGRMVVVEAKGGSSPLGSRRVTGRRGVSAQQGTLEYYMEIVESMTARGGSYEAAANLLAAVDPSQVVYLHIETPITTVSGTGPGRSQVGALRVNAFDLSRTGLWPEAPSTTTTP